MNYIRLDNPSLNYQRLTPPGIRKFEFVQSLNSSAGKIYTQWKPFYILIESSQKETIKF